MLPRIQCHFCPSMPKCHTLCSTNLKTICHLKDIEKVNKVGQVSLLLMNHEQSVIHMLTNNMLESLTWEKPSLKVSPSNHNFDNLVKCFLHYNSHIMHKETTLPNSLTNIEMLSVLSIETHYGGLNPRLQPKFHVYSQLKSPKVGIVLRWVIFLALDF